VKGFKKRELPPEKLECRHRGGPWTSIRPFVDRIQGVGTQGVLDNERAPHPALLHLSLPASARYTPSSLAALGRPQLEGARINQF